ncbi:hypothetical protein POM88_019681 [Heracleum sosnowskyi]|uniref:Protein kinase domain-containing protein n=1 Tax=Heracleum sosnowskyi TaxID=360622 RepID=A0AAD8MQQ2_9APIA|nr:hypothetical protein POM88_019681 [Heracleum sosnowskyi]
MLLLVLAKLLTPRYKNKNVAIKVVNKGETPEEIKKREGRFAREVAMLSKVQHKNLVKFIGACKEPASVIVTELLVGGTLRKYLVNMRPRCLDLRVAVGFALDIARAMECLHSHGIIHRDLKPEAVEGEVPGHPNPLVQINYTLPSTQPRVQLPISIQSSYQQQGPAPVLPGASTLLPINPQNMMNMSVRPQIKVAPSPYAKQQGKPNLFQHPEAPNCSYFAWTLYEEEKLSELYDSKSLETRDKFEAFRAIQIGILCVNTYPEDRPSMTDPLTKTWTTSSISLTDFGPR